MTEGPNPKAARTTGERALEYTAQGAARRA